MRVAVLAQTALAVRTVRVLAAEPSVEVVGLVEGSVRAVADSRSVRWAELEHWDVLVSDGPLPDGRTPETRVVTADLLPRDQQISGANLVVGIGGSLAALELARSEQPTSILVAHTSTGQLLYRGERFRFPAPVGALYARRTSTDHLPEGIDLVFEAPLPRAWAGVLIQASAASEIRIVGVADDRQFLEAIALASTAIATGRGAYPGTAARSYEAPAAFLEAAVASGLTVASYSLPS